MKADLLLELGCEDLPARFVKPLADALSKGVVGGLNKNGIVVGEVRNFATPRRIAVWVKAVPDRQPEQSSERLGPAIKAAIKDGKPTPAALGFAKSCGVDISALGEKDGKLHFTSTSPGHATQALLPDIFEDTLKQMDALVPKRMRWGEGSETFVRPVQWIVCLLGSKVIPLQRFGLTSSNKTYGHRFHAPKAIILKSPADYEKKLKSAKVWADFAGRRAEIQKKIDVAAKKFKGVAHSNETLLDEVTALVEWPVVISGRMDERFMTLPPEVIIATIEHNQRYFPIFGSDGRLLPAFITVSNIESRDKTQVIIGNERVVRPRLSDALFFWDQDRNKPISDYMSALDKVTFQQKLGSVSDKSKRIAAISAKLSEGLAVDFTAVEQAAALCKADLVSRMVFEFPELQGVMGGYYAKGWGASDAISVAIREHYQPTQSGGAIPSTPLGCIIALADKIDTLAGIFAIGQKPSASKDPYALRRAALGVLRILIEGEMNLDLQSLLRHAVALQPGIKCADTGTLVNELLRYHWDRLRAHYVETDVAPEVIAAVMATGVTFPLDIHKRIIALRDFARTPAATKLAAAHKRVRNILRGAANAPPTACEPAKLVEAPEQALHQQTQRVRADVAKLSGQLDYASALVCLADIQPAVDRFFDSTLVMAENRELRANRLALLSELDLLCRSVADISCLPG